MRITIKATNLTLSSPLRVYAEEKLGGVERLVRRWDAAGAVAIHVDIGRTTKHHRKGQVYYAEANLGLPGAMLRAREEHWDVRAAITKVRAKLKKEIDKYKEKTVGRT